MYELPEQFKGTYLLEFADPTFDGLEVRMGRHTFAAADAAAKLKNINIDKARAGELDIADWGALQAALAEFSEALLWWNLTIDGREIGTDYASIRKLDVIFVMQIFILWLKALVGVDWQEFSEDEIPMNVPSEVLAELPDGDVTE